MGTQLVTRSLSFSIAFLSVFATIPASPATAVTIRGDLDGDGMIGIADTIMALRIAVGSALSTPELTVVGDVAPPPDGDGEIGVADAMLLLRVAVGLLSPADLSPDPTPALHHLVRLFFLHHSTGWGIVSEGDVRGVIQRYNTRHGTDYVFWDHGYNGDGLYDAANRPTGTNYDIPDDNTDPIGLHRLWTGNDARVRASRNAILDNHEVIAFKSCFPASQIDSATALQQYKDWYLAIRNFTDTRPDRLFVVMSTPPLHRLATNVSAAKNARAFANWLKSSAYLEGHPNLRCFDLFDLLAHPDDGSSAANRLRYDYENSHTDGDSHPNGKANRTVGLLFGEFLCDAAASY